MSLEQVLLDAGTLPTDLVKPIFTKRIQRDHRTVRARKLAGIGQVGDIGDLKVCHLMLQKNDSSTKMASMDAMKSIAERHRLEHPDGVNANAWSEWASKTLLNHSK